MKLQDLHPYDSAVVGLNNIYFVDYRGDFHINAKFILAANTTIRSGSTYVLIHALYRKKCNVHQVRLQDAYYDDGTIYLIVQDIVYQKTFLIDQQIECTRNHYKWLLIDIDLFNDKMNTNLIKSYRGKCSITQTKSVTEEKSKQNHDDDLLEFEF
jgi:hypothetical protein